jgi:large subunit ribosomal protein L14e
MNFTRFVEVGRVVLINYGPLEGKLATIVDIVDSNKCLIQGPEGITGVKRQIISYSRIYLTDIKVNIPKNAREKTLKLAWAKVDVMAKWDATGLAKKNEKTKIRAGLSDFDRFKVMVAKKQKRTIIAKKLKELKA